MAALRDGRSSGPAKTQSAHEKNGWEAGGTSNGRTSLFVSARRVQAPPMLGSIDAIATTLYNYNPTWSHWHPRTHAHEGRQAAALVRSRGAARLRWERRCLCPPRQLRNQLQPPPRRRNWSVGLWSARLGAGLVPDPPATRMPCTRPGSTCIRSAGKSLSDEAGGERTQLSRAQLKPTQGARTLHWSLHGDNVNDHPLP